VAFRSDTDVALHVCYELEGRREVFGDGKSDSPSCAHAQATAFSTSKQPFTIKPNKVSSKTRYS